MKKILCADTSSNYIIMSFAYYKYYDYKIQISYKNKVFCGLNKIFIMNV